jgi:hypothetical protein
LEGIAAAPAGRAAPKLTPVEQALRRVASIKAADATPFARFFPDLAVVQVRGNDRSARLYSFVHNREHANISWILGESDRLAPQEDSLTVRAGVPGAYPNMFFVVPEAEIDVFSSAAARLKSAADYEQPVDRFGVRRSNEMFWSVYDAINSAHLANDPVRSGTWISRATRSKRNRRGRSLGFGGRSGGNGSSPPALLAHRRQCRRPVRHRGCSVLTCGTSAPLHARGARVWVEEPLHEIRLAERPPHPARPAYDFSRARFWL